MNKKLSFACLGACCLVGIGLYWRDRPHVSTASLQELTSVSPAELVTPPAQAAGAEQRYKELLQLAQNFNDGYKGGTAMSGKKRADLPRYEASAAALLKQGPMLRDEARGDDYTDELRPLASLSTAIAKDAKGSLDAGQTDRCLKLVGTVIGLASAVKQAGGTHVIYLVMSSLDNIATNMVIQCIRSNRMQPADLKRILAEVPQGAGGDKVLANDWAIDYRENVLPVLSDFDQVRQKLALIHREDYDPKSPVVGCYDAVETAKQLASIYQIGQKNALADWKHQNDGDTKIIVDAAHRVPLYGSRPGGNWANRTLFTIEMNTTPNSLGSELVGEAGYGETEIKRASVTTATRYELARAIAALRLYSLEHGGDAAPDLSVLAKNGILPSIPMDWFQMQPVKYDRRRELVYALGPLGVDESSLLRADGWTPQRTLGFFVSRPN